MERVSDRQIQRPQEASRERHDYTQHSRHNVFVVVPFPAKALGLSQAGHPRSHSMEGVHEIQPKVYTGRDYKKRNMTARFCCDQGISYR